MSHELTPTGLQPDSYKVTANNEMQPSADWHSTRSNENARYLARFFKIAELDLKMVACQRTINMINTAAATDEQYALLLGLQQIAHGWPDSPAAVPAEIREYYYFFADELTSVVLAYKGLRVIIPVRTKFSNRLHSSHFGLNSAIRRAKCSVFYCGLTKDIKNMINKCSVCHAFQQEKQKETFQCQVDRGRK